MIDTNKERDAFEDWYAAQWKTRPGCFGKYQDPDDANAWLYLERDVDNAWFVWQARAVLSAPQEASKPEMQKDWTRSMNLEADIRRVIGWEKPINDFEVVKELQEYIAQMADSQEASKAVPVADEPEWIDDPHDIEQGRIRNPKWKPSQPEPTSKENSND